MDFGVALLKVFMESIMLKLMMVEESAVLVCILGSEEDRFRWLPICPVQNRGEEGAKPRGDREHDSYCWRPNIE